MRSVDAPVDVVPVKVCFFIPSFDGGGAERQCVHLVDALSQRQDLEVSLAHYHEGVNFGLLSEHVRKIRIPTGSNYDPRNVLRARRLFAREGFDIVFSWLHACDVHAWAARAIGGRFKWVMAERDSWYPADLRYWLRSMVGRRADLVIANSREGDKYWVARNVPQSRHAVVDNILPDAWFLDSPQSVTKELVCYAGRLEPQKNVSVVVESFMQLAMRRPETRFVVAGQGSLEGELRLISEATNGAVTMLPFQKDIRSVFDRTAVFVNVSSHEGKPNTVIENLALGNRVVLSRIPEHVDLVGEGYRFLVDLDTSPAHLASVVEEALATPMSDDEKAAVRCRLAGMRANRVADAYAELLIRVAGA